MQTGLHDYMYIVLARVFTVIYTKVGKQNPGPTSMQVVAQPTRGHILQRRSSLWEARYSAIFITPSLSYTAVHRYGRLVTA